MNSSRLSIVALSMAIMVSIGSSASTATTHFHPQFTVTEDRTLSLRETGSRLVVDTIENALRQGGLALFDERFQIDSSLDWVLGEAVGGELDAVIPLWSKGRHTVFTQPGFVLWKGLADDDRLDGNLGVVYRTETIRGIIGGVSLFYDHDFQIGHSRLGIGVDAQKDGFYGAFNYYHPLSDTQDAREGYVEDALQGMDAGVAVESDVTRVGGNVGYWLFQGDEEVKDEWKFSYGFDAGLRLMPGVFLEGRMERHDKKASFGQRASVGLAFRFTLPNLDGKSYGDGGKGSNLYRPIDREKRILYEERETGPKVSIVRNGSEFVVEGGTVELDIQLSEPLAEDVTLNFIGSGSATYGTDGDWTMSVGGTVCDTVTGTDCQVGVMAGATTTSDELVVTIRDDLRTGEAPETIVLSVEIASAGGTRLMPGGSLGLTIPADLPLPSVSLSADNTNLAEGESATLTVILSEMVDANVVINLLEGEGGAANYGTGMDWHLNNGTDCNTAVGTSCQITILANQESATATVNVSRDSTAESPEDFIVSIVVDSRSTHLAQAGDAASLPFTISTDNTIKFASSTLTVTEDQANFGNLGFIDIELSSNLPAGIGITFAISGNAEDGDYGIQASNRQIPSGADYVNGVYTFPTNTMEARLVFEAVRETASPDTDNEEIIIQLTDPNNNLPTGWSIVEPSTITVTITDEG